MQNWQRHASVRLNQRAVIKFLKAENVAPVVIHRENKGCLWELMFRYHTVRRWCIRALNEPDATLNLGDKGRSDNRKSGIPKTLCTMGLGFTVLSHSIQSRSEAITFSSVPKI